MAKFSVSMDDETFDRLEDAREALGEQDPLGATPDRSKVVTQAVVEWLDAHPELAEDGSQGNGILALAAN